MGTSTTLVLHGLRLRSPATSAAVADRFGLDPAEVAIELKGLGERGWVQFRDGRLSGWSLTALGRGEGERLLADELDALGQRSTVEQGYREFLGLNGELLSICTDWQVVVRDGIEVPNDHSDGQHDAMVLSRLASLDVAARPVTRRLSGALGRFGRYEARLSFAAARVAAGDPDWLTRPTIDSYHTVWFELHEDLLATLGRTRTQERPHSATSRPTTSRADVEEHV